MKILTTTMTMINSNKVRSKVFENE